MNQTEKFLKLIDPNADKFLFACFDYRKKLGERIFYTDIATGQRILKTRNDEGYCCYFTVNETQGKSRRKTDITRCRAIWVEDDTPRDAPRTDFPLLPSIVVNSSPGKYHYYWLTSTTKADEWNAVMQTMVEVHGCDKQARDISRVLRVPGFIHKKKISDPFTTELVDSNGHVYTWLEIKMAFPPKQRATVRERAADLPKDKFDPDEALARIAKSEEFHGALVSLSQSCANKGWKREDIKRFLNLAMLQVPEDKRDDRFYHRDGDQHVYECIDSAIDNYANEQEFDFDADSLERKSIEDSLEYPPGLMGVFCKEMLEVQAHPNKVLAIVTGFCIVAGIIGRRYNVSGTGLNIYAAVMARSGIGKSVAKNSINGVLSNHSQKLMSPYESFIGDEEATGTKAIINMLQEGLSKVCAYDEAGLMLMSKSGDKEGLTRTLLDLFSSSGYGEKSMNKRYSSSDNTLPKLTSPALTILYTSVPESFRAGLREGDAIRSGLIARMWTLKTDAPKPYLNRNKKKYEDLDRNCMDRINVLAKDCARFQIEINELKVVDVAIPEFVHEDSKMWVDRENKFHADGDELRTTHASRAWIKIIKLASIASVFNGKEEIGEEEYDWARKTIELEFEFLQDTFTHDSNNDILDLIKNLIAPKISKCIKGEYKDAKMNAPKDLAKNKIFTHVNLNQICKNIQLIRELDDDPKRGSLKTGITKIVDEMVKNGLVTRLDREKLRKYNSRVSIAYKIEPDFSEFIK